MIHFVIGTRAQLFKMAPIMLECEKRGLQWRWVYAAMHKETIKETLETFGLPDPHYTVVKWDDEARTISKAVYWFSRMLASLFRSKKILAGYTGKEHIVLVHGDTPVTPVSALYGKLTRTPVMHVESGLRSFNIFHPFPEEINRLITFRLANYFACPGEWATNNLRKIKGVKINTHENTQIDVLRFGLKNLDRSKVMLSKEKFVVLSTHRYENVFNKERFEKIIGFAEEVAKTYEIIMPGHPVTTGQLKKTGLIKRLEANKNIHLLPRLEYLDFLKYISQAEFVMTDGGGNQEELYHLGKPTLILRDATERQEGMGRNAVLSRLDAHVVNDFIKNYTKYRRSPTDSKMSPSSIIVDEIEKFG
jgi:UDP-N-acetylglucosamine 2-epimerase (non-hydrolysing)